MSELIERVAEGVARRTESRRTFLGRIATAGFALAAGLATSASLSGVAEAAHCGCNPPCGQYCLTYLSGVCDSYSGACGGGCSNNTKYWAPGNCWSTAQGCTCCDCWCPGNYGAPACQSGGSFECVCEGRSPTAPAGTIKARDK